MITTRRSRYVRINLGAVDIMRVLYLVLEFPTLLIKSLHAAPESQCPKPSCIGIPLTKQYVLLVSVRSLLLRFNTLRRLAIDLLTDGLTRLTLTRHSQSESGMLL